MFISAVSLLVLPLFLLICIKILKNSNWNNTIIGKALILLFYIVVIGAVLTSLYLFTQIEESSSSQLNIDDIIIE